jgi:hypothetical protein
LAALVIKKCKDIVLESTSKVIAIVCGNDFILNIRPSTCGKNIASKNGNSVAAHIPVHDENII